MDSGMQDVASKLRDQWTNPGDIFSLLLILGGDIIQRALAQQVGHTWTPIVFSFGHVAYAINALLAVFGDGRLMPAADFDVSVTGAKSGFARANKSWVIGRLMRDQEAREARALAGTDGTCHHEALRVSVFKPREFSSLPDGVPRRDWLWWSGVVAIVLQLGITVIPWANNGNWSIFLITGCGIILSIAQTIDPQWKREKWDCPTSGGWTVSITQGNGKRHVVVILGKDHLPDMQHGLDFEILAANGSRFVPSRYSQILISAMVPLWGALLITATGTVQDTWYLILIGSMGMFHNLFVAAAPRESSSQGIHLDTVAVVAGPKVASVLETLETRFPTVGSSLVPVFFPGGLRIKPEDESFWIEAAHRRGASSLSEFGISVQK